MSYAFISHAKEDRYFAFYLSDRLKRYAVDCWIDCLNIPVGKKWQDEIDTAIDEAYAVIVVVSPESRKSEYVTYEWAYALGKGKTVIPVRIRDTERHPKLSAKQELDFSTVNRKLLPIQILAETLREEQENFEVQRRSNDLSDAKSDHAVQLKDVVQQKDYAVLYHTIFILEKAGNTELIHELIQQSQDDPNMRATVINGLGEAKSTFPEALSLIARSLYDEEYAVRQAAVVAAGKCGEPIIDNLSKILRAREDTYRINNVPVGHMNAIRALTRIGTSNAVSWIMYAARMTNEDIRGSAASALGTLQIIEAVPILVDMLDDYREAWWQWNDNDQREPVYLRIDNIASQSLISIGSPEALAAYESWYAQFEADDRGDVSYPDER